MFLNYFFNLLFPVYNENDEYIIVPYKNKKISESIINMYHVDKAMINVAKNKLKKINIEERRKDFHPTSGVLGELKDYFDENKLIY